MQRVTDPSLSLAVRFPAVAAEWDYMHPQNAGKSPASVMAISGKEYWWVCTGCSRGYPAIVANRTQNGSGCDRCSRRASKQESDLRDHLNGRCAGWRDGLLARTDGVTRRRWNVDAIHDALKVVVEWDGHYWHSEQANPGITARDAAKAEDLRAQGWTVVRVREEPLTALHDHDVVVPKDPDFAETAEAVFARLVGLGVQSEAA